MGTIFFSFSRRPICFWPAVSTYSAALPLRLTNSDPRPHRKGFLCGTSAFMSKFGKGSVVDLLCTTPSLKQ